MVVSMSKVTAYSSAYPGSMFEREDGDYLKRDDAYSLAGALVTMVAALQNDLGDMTTEACRLEAELASMRASRDALAVALKLAHKHPGDPAMWLDEAGAALAAAKDRP
jgi:uncharacterized small protein (DUF1192 family)